ncbi:MAG: glycoside-pentoside-hexuronide (GPH):cation symporter [Puniceicoccaceae bacterium]
MTEPAQTPRTAPASPKDPSEPAARGKLAPLKKSEIFGYTVGDLGINLNFQLIGFFLAYFYTDVFGISPVHVAGLFLAARIWDAVNDPLMGLIADRTRTRWGQFRPYLLFGAIPLNLILLACFYTPDLSEGGKVAYAYVTYFLHGMAFTAVGLPFSSISAVMTRDQQERSVIASYRMFFAVVLAMGLIGIGVRPFVALFATEQTGFFVSASILAAVSSLLLIYSFTQSKERVVLRRKSYPLKATLSLVLKNDALMVLAAAMLLNTAVWVTANAVAIYYFKYILGNENLISVFFAVMIPANLLGTVLAPILTRRLGKRETFIAGSIVVALFYSSRYVLPPDALVLFFVLSLVATVGQMICAVTQWAMLPDTVEYGQWKTGIRSEGIPVAFFSFTQKAGMALAGGFAAFFLGISGYVANVDQTPEATHAIRLLFNIWPAVFSIACAIVLVLYKLSEKRYRQIMVELTAREDAEDAEDAAANL